MKSFLMVIFSGAILGHSARDQYAALDPAPTHNTTLSIRLMPIEGTDDDKIAMQKLTHAQQIARELLKPLRRAT